VLNVDTVVMTDRKSCMCKLRNPTHRF